MDDLTRSAALVDLQNIIGIADKGVTSTCDFLVQLVEHDVAQKWTQRTALRSTLLARVPKTFGYHTAAQIFVYKANHSAILYRTAEYLYEFAVVNCVKEAHESLHSPIPFGFRPISLGAVISIS